MRSSRASRMLSCIAFLGPDYPKDLSSIQALLENFREHSVQLEYAFSTSVRGDALYQQLLSINAVSVNGTGKRYLDIGCAYGGFLIAFAKAGYAVEGVEFDPGLAELGCAHLRSVGQREAIKVGDFLDDSVIAPEPTYDVITCNDVIEHVSDPARCLRKIYKMLRPGAVAWIETVNKRSMRNVHSDIHFQTFGTHLLDHHSAGAAYRQYTGSPDYQVSDFFEPEWYLNLARGLPEADARLIYAAHSDFDCGVELDRLFSRYLHWRQNDRQRLDPFLQHEIERALFAYVSRMIGALEQAHAQGAHHDFFNNWIDPIIRLLVLKAGERRTDCAGPRVTGRGLLPRGSS
jgi:2-polyprenyl-3-methyl-5-hydroxy-6-metoxy-1,4-benzoquinol methylase